ncbi:hypothetical protein BCS42_05890 [Crenothrix sp. D3]|jgi:hypothetical protein|nr:hypothetical protein BCS42_05890 [Crenothrix sp. D3]
MKTKDIQKTLETALLDNGNMEQGLYEYELEELLDELIESMIADNDDFLFAVTTQKNNLTGKLSSAMLLIEKSGAVHINEFARDRLKALWKDAYVRNMKKLIPAFAKQLQEGDIPINGVKTVLQA